MEGVFQVRKFVHQTPANNALPVFDPWGWQFAAQEPLHPEKRIINPARNRERQ